MVAQGNVRQLNDFNCKEYSQETTIQIALTRDRPKVGFGLCFTKPLLPADGALLNHIPSRRSSSIAQHPAIRESDHITGDSGVRSLTWLPGQNQNGSVLCHSTQGPSRLNFRTNKVCTDPQQLYLINKPKFLLEILLSKRLIPNIQSETRIRRHLEPRWL
jgi:hypothetical protein